MQRGLRTGVFVFTQILWIRNTEKGVHRTEVPGVSWEQGGGSNCGLAVGSSVCGDAGAGSG